MNGDEECEFYSSQERDYPLYPYDSDLEEGPYQVYDHHQYEDDIRYESDGCYDDEGYHYEDGSGAFVQQVQDDALVALMTEILGQQKETIERLEQIDARQKMMESKLAQQAIEIEYMGEVLESSNEEVLESIEDQYKESSLEVLGQAFKEENDDEDLSAVDYILGFFSNDELDPHLEGSLEVEHETARGLGIHEELFDDANEGLSRESPRRQEFISEKEDIETWTPKHHNEDIESWLSIEPWSSVEDPYLFTLPPSKFLSFRPYMDISIKRNSYDPSVPKEAYFLKGSKSVFDVHLKLGGRKYIWDIKIS